MRAAGAAEFPARSARAAAAAAAHVAPAHALRGPGRRGRVGRARGAAEFPAQSAVPWRAGGAARHRLAALRPAVRHRLARAPHGEDQAHHRPRRRRAGIRAATRPRAHRHRPRLRRPARPRTRAVRRPRGPAGQPERAGPAQGLCRTGQRRKAPRLRPAVRAARHRRGRHAAAPAFKADLCPGAVGPARFRPASRSAARASRRTGRRRQTGLVRLSRRGARQGQAPPLAVSFSRWHNGQLAAARAGRDAQPQLRGRAVVCL